jgi:hypothetical protein
MRRRTAPSHSSGSGSSLPRLRSLSSSADRLPEIVERVLEKLEREFVFVSVGILLVEEILPVLHEGGPMPMSRGGVRHSGPPDQIQRADGALLPLGRPRSWQDGC